jgi:hypothetical protein
LGGSDAHAPDTWRFSIEVATAWERALDEATVPQTRKVKLRSAMTMSPDSGGVFDVLLGLVRHGLGGRAGDGRQFVSWIHDQDFIRAIYYLIEHDALKGPVNLAAPHPAPSMVSLSIFPLGRKLPMTYAFGGARHNHPQRLANSARRRS